MMLLLSEKEQWGLIDSEVITRTPQQLSRTPPNQAGIVIVDIPNPDEALLRWLRSRTQPTLWWRPKHQVIPHHCTVYSRACSLNKFINMMSQLYQSKGMITLGSGELMSLLESKRTLFVSRYPLSGTLQHHNKSWMVGLIVNTGLDDSLKAIEKRFSDLKSTWKCSTWVSVFWKNELGQYFMLLEE